MEFSRSHEKRLLSRGKAYWSLVSRAILSLLRFGFREHLCDPIQSSAGAQRHLSRNMTKYDGPYKRTCADLFFVTRVAISSLERAQVRGRTAEQPEFPVAG